MAIVDDFSIATNGNIRHVSGTGTYTVIAFHRWLGDLMDDALAANNDLLDITDATASERSTDNIITLKTPYNIDDDAAKYFYDGSIVQGTGGTEVIYEGILVFAAPGMYLSIVQNGAVISGASNFWTTGLNADAANGISHRFMLKVKTGGADIDGRRIIGQTREFKYTYSEFKINGTARGNNVLALTYATDLNNQNEAATVAGWTDVVNNTVGYSSLDVDGNTVNENYYSTWTRGSRTINNFYERMKWVTRRGTSEIIYPATTGLNGELFRGITHEIPVGLATQTGTFSAVEPVSWTGGTGRLLAINSVGAARQMWLQLVTGVAPSAGLVITGGTSSAYVATNAETIATTVLAGTGSVITITFGTQAVLPYPAGTTFTVAGCIPTAYNGTYVSTGGSTTTATAVSTATGAQTQAGTIVGVVVERTLSFPFAGASTGSAIIGAYGFGMVASELTASDKLTDLTNTLRTPPNNVIFTVSGLEIGEDRVLVAPLGREFAYDTESGTTFTRGETLTFSGGGTAYLSFLRDDGVTGRMQVRMISGTVPVDNETITGASAAAVVNGTVVASEDPRQLKLLTTLSAAAETTVACIASSIPTDTPSTGTIRVQVNSGIYKVLPYSSYTTSAFTLALPDSGAGALTITVVATAGTFTRTTGSFITDGFVVGHRISTTNFTNAGNNTTKTISSVTATVITVTLTTGLVDENTGGGNERVQTTGADFTADNATGGSAETGNSIFISYIDKLATAASATFTGVYSADRLLFVRVRDGASTPIKTFETTGTLGSAGGSATAIRTSDA